ncbi:WD40 repeat-like protein [Thelephora ganbajun]|uniref:WD40 repeat-like protein n=1 Tax=Thelephora ganbajun TaxID=370292 RepID=A0ACB6Z8V2_THEGA|nr:WD40 repeat-like protein [Thelephora ganbajun]
MIREGRPAESGGASGSNSDQTKKQRVAGATEILLEAAKESTDRFPPLMSALGGVTALIEHYEQSEDVKDVIKDLKPHLDRFKQNITTTPVDGDPEETGRCEKLTSALEEIEKRSQELLAKSTVARFARKDSGEVARLVEWLREVITHYQISQHQAIYDRIVNLTSSFDTLLKFHEKSPGVKNKLDSVMARLDRLCSEEDDDNGLWDENEHERRVKLFDTLRMIEDDGNVLYNRISAQGYKECQDDVQAASSMADDIRDAVIDYQMALQRAIHDKSCRLIDAADLSILNSCRRAHKAGYQHEDRRGCLRGTRETVLNEVESWASDFEKSPVFWLNGLAGTGKSTIAQTVSERVFANGLLGASFFCSRDFEDRSDLRSIFPTLAFQLAHKYPSFRSAFVPLLRSNPDIVDESLMNQMGKLIVDPLKSANVWTVIVIDALDECKDEEPQSAILSVLGRFVEQIPKVKFFITGRPEPRIKTGFRLPLLVDSTDVFVLHDVHPPLINSDIRLFLKHELSEVARRRRLEGWPSDEHIDVLCDRAGGLFVYAVATVRFLDSRIHLPKRRLEVIINIPEHTIHEGKTRFNSKTTLDSLYTSILETAFSEDQEDVEVDSKVRSTIGTVVLLANPLPPSGIAELIDLDPDEVALFLTLLQSLLAFDEDSSQPVKPFHKSFPDFITDPSRCTDTRFLVSPGILHLELAMNCLRVMNDGLERNLLSLPDYSLNSEVEDLETRISDRISDALRYACRSWHSHLTKTEGDATGVIFHLRVFLEEKFLAWLEVVSVLGVVGGAIVALEQLIVWLHEISRNETLLDTARDYSHFVARFFEPISVSAAHIYHSALELSPLSSIVRRRYYCQRHSSLPRVAVGTEESWGEGIIIPGKDHHSCTWSPCGQFVATQSREAVEIRDSLSLELLSTLKLTIPTPDEVTSLVAYSTDGRSIAFLSGTSLVIWDIQTGGAAKEVDHDGGARNTSLLWSLDGSTIGIVENKGPGTRTYVVHAYDVTSGATHSPITFESTDEPHPWAYGTSFRVMTTERVGQARTINIFDVGSILTKVESFHIGPWEENLKIMSFSQTTHRISCLFPFNLTVLDIRNSRYLLRQPGNAFHNSHCFSSDGSLFAASRGGDVCIWKYTSGCYIGWRECSIRGSGYGPDFLRFSPTSSLLLTSSNGILRLWRLDGPPIHAPPDGSREFIIPSPSGGYIVAGHKGDSTVTITNLLPQTPPCVIDTGVVIKTLALTGNILLALGSGTIAAWRLTEEGVVDGVFADGRADRDSTVWTISVSNQPGLFVGDQTVAIERGGNVIHAYHTETGEVLKPVRKFLRPFPRLWGTPLNAMGRLHEHQWADPNLDHFRQHEWGTLSEGSGLVSRNTLREGWVKDPEGKHLLWLPVEWRNPSHTTDQSCTVLWLFLHLGATVIIKF